MKLATFSESGRTRIGVVVDDGVIDVSAVEPDLPEDMIALLEAGDLALQRIKEIECAHAPQFALDTVALMAPVPKPGKILAIGLNYKDHIEESGLETPQHQTWFNKQINAANGPYAPVTLPSVSPYLDYEAEMCFVIGKRARHVPRERAHEVIAGYCVGNDYSVRDWQIQTPQFTLAKSFDTHAPFGPWLTTADELSNPHGLDFSLTVNGVRKQRSNTRNLVFDCFEQVALLSTAFTLDPGDVIFTGTPGGVGALRDPKEFLQDGDVVRVEFETLGAIENIVRTERPMTIIGGAP